MLPMPASTADTSLLLPTGFDLVWWLVAAGVVSISVAALVRIGRSPDTTGTARLVWVVLVVLAPPIGAIAALVTVRSRRSTAQVLPSPRR